MSTGYELLFSLLYFFFYLHVYSFIYSFVQTVQFRPQIAKANRGERRFPGYNSQSMMIEFTDMDKSQIK